MRRADRVVVLDASYGDYGESLADCAGRLAPILSRRSALLPVPADGRGPELAWHAATACVRARAHACRGTILLEFAQTNADSRQ